LDIFCVFLLFKYGGDVMKQSEIHCRLAGMLGNILEHYDAALFGLLAPFIAPLFFEHKDPLTALILTYGMFSLGLLMRPLGSLFFGWVGDHFGRTHALSCSLVGMALATFGMGCLPTYAEVGIYAPLFLCLGRILQNFCAAGEISGGAIFVLEHTESSKKDIVSSFYSVSTIVGILLASLMVTLFSYFDLIDKGWRFLFWLGGWSAVIGIFFRVNAMESQEYLSVRRSTRIPFFTLLKQHRQALLAVILVSGFGYTTYSLAFVLMNGYIPLVTSLTKTQVMGANTFLLVIDMLLLPFFGYWAQRVSREKIMFSAAVISVITALPLFYLFKGANLGTVIVARLVIVTLGVAFSATYHAWAQERIPPTVRYTILSLGYATGSQLIGAPAPAICLWLYRTLSWEGAPALYLMVTAALAAYAVKKTNREKMPIFQDVRLAGK
jgi:MHS family proline/betaine transporter-like MFS transporter